MLNPAPYIEHSNLSPVITDLEVDRLVREAKEYSFAGVCVPPFWVKRASREIYGADLRLVTVIGFPLGYQMTETKIEEIKLAMRDGADELDVVMNLSSFKINFPWTKIDLVRCAKLIHEQEKILKVIIETAYLNEEEIIRAAKLCIDCGVDYVKTSTGFASSGAKVEDIKLLRETLPSHVGIKASGGIKTYNDCVKLIEAGADRIGTSSAVNIMKEYTERKGSGY